MDNPPYRNIGRMTNKGFEVQLSWADRIGDFNYALTGMASYNSNKVDYMAEVVTVPTAARTGRRLDALFGMWPTGSTTGTISTSAANSGGLPKPTFGAVQPGDIKYKNLNGDTVIDENDQTAIGDSYLPQVAVLVLAGGILQGVRPLRPLPGGGRP